MMAAAAAGAVAIGMWVYFSQKEGKQLPLTPTQQACMNEAMEMYRAALSAELARSTQNTKTLEILPMLPNSAAIAAELEEMKHQDRLAAIQVEAAICAKIASCFPNRPQKGFDNCFEAAMKDRQTDNSR